MLVAATQCADWSQNLAIAVMTIAGLVFFAYIFKS